MKKSLEVLVTKNAMSVISDPSKATATKKAVERAMEFAEGVDFRGPRTLMIENCPLGVHVDPKRGIVVILSKFAGWPGVTDDLVNELIPFTTAVALA
ncbi:MAG: hypothetical protein BGO01_16895 [Armatimonadetes bacterium 55-13]|jgi:hypothetical protein|nr:MAG: hypothetical protein BGO01_16895 [Armatimonadetes bacterium 55-13]